MRPGRCDLCQPVQEPGVGAVLQTHLPSVCPHDTLPQANPPSPGSREAAARGARMSAWSRLCAALLRDHHPAAGERSTAWLANWSVSGRPVCKADVGLTEGLSPPVLPTTQRPPLGVRIHEERPQGRQAPQQSQDPVLMAPVLGCGGESLASVPGQ